MSSENSKRIAKNSFHLYMRMLFNLGVSLYTSRVVLNVLGVEDFGLFNVVGGVVAMFSFLNNSMAGATQRFLTYEIGKGEHGELGKTFNISVTIHLIIAVLVFVLGETIGLWFVYNKLVIPIERFSAALWVYHLSILTAFVSIVNVPYYGLVMAKERMDIFAYLSVLQTVLKLLIVFVLVFFGFDKLKLYAILTAGVTLLIFICYQTVCRKLFIESIVNKLIWEKARFKQMSTFALWVMNGNLAVVGYTQGLNVLLNLFFGPSVNAARGVAVQVQNAIMGFASSFQSSINPQITKSYAKRDLSYMHSLVFTSSKIGFFLLYMVALPILIETDYLLEIWLKNVPAHSVSFVRLILLTCLVTPFSNVMIVSVHATGKLKKFQLWEGTGLLLIVPVAYFVLKMGYKPEAVFIVHFIISVIIQGLRVYIIAPMIGMSILKYFKEVILRVIYVIPLAFLISCIPLNNLPVGWLRLLLSALFSGFSMMILVYFLGLNKQEKIFLKQYINGLRQKMS